jgi:adenylate cyclase
MSTEAQSLLRESEISAERSIAYARCIIGVSVAIFFFLVVAPTLPPGNPALDLRPIFIAFCIGYFLVGVATFYCAHHLRFRGWMTWLFATLDLCFWYGLLVATVLIIELPGNYIIALPPALIAFIILAVVALRNNPLLQAYTLVVVVVAFISLYRMAPDPVSESVEGVDSQIEILFMPPPNVVRLLMVALTGLILIYLAIRTRRLLNRAIDETVRRANLSRYLPAQLVGRLAQNDRNRLLSGTSQAAAVLFVDIRGFTAFAEDMNPEELSEFLGTFRRIVASQVHANEGIVDKFVGDSVMAVFGAPDQTENDAHNALGCALNIVRSIQEWNIERRASDLHEVQIGVGAHWGNVFCGAVGDTDRLEFTVLGDTVNVAARLEQLTKEVGYPIVASRSSLSRAGVTPGPEAGWIAVGEAPIRGRKGSLPVFARRY